MKIKTLKKIFYIIALAAFAVMIGVAGRSDLEQEVKRVLITDSQFYGYMLISFSGFLLSCLGIKVCTILEEQRKRSIRIRKNARTNVA